MDELQQISTVLRNLGILVKQIRITQDGNIQMILTWAGKTIVREYTIEEIRSGLVTDARAAPAAPPEQKHKLTGYVSRLLTR